MEKLKEYIQQIRGVSYKPSDSLDILKEGYIPLLRANNINNGKINFENLIYVKKEKVKAIQYLKKGDILICTSSGSKELVGKAGTIKEDIVATFGAFCKVIRLKECCNYNYFNHYFQSNYYKNMIQKSSNGANINNLKTENFDNLFVNLLSYEEQTNIANKLDKAQKIIDIREKQIEDLDKLIKSQFVEMFVDNKYPLKTLEELTGKITDGSHNPPTGVEEDTGFVMLSSQNIINDVINYDNARFLKKEDFEKENKRTDLKGGDVLLTIVGTVGRTAIIRDENNITLQRSVAVIKPKKDINSIYLVGAINSDDIKRQLERGAKGVAQKGIYLNDLKKILIEVPPIELQNQFAKIVKLIDKQKLEIRKSLDEMEKLKESLMNRYFGGQKNG